MPTRPARPTSPTAGHVPGHYFDPDPGGDADPRHVELVLADLHLRLATGRGVFARDRVDAGTRLLLAEDASPGPDARVVADVGCGYGPIAITLALRAPGAVVWAVDVNARARELCARNAADAGVADRVRVVAPEEVPDDLELDAWWSNPPIRIGKPALHALLDHWLARLAGPGTAHLVVQRHLGADSLAARFADEGWLVRRHASRQGYRLLQLTRSPTRPGRDAS